MDARTLKGRTHSSWQLTMGGPGATEREVLSMMPTFSAWGKVFLENICWENYEHNLKSGCILAKLLRLFTLNKLLTFAELQFPCQ